MWCEGDLVGQDCNLFVGLDDGDLDVEGCDLVGKRVAVAFERPGRGAVHGHTGGPDVTGDAGEDYDVAGVLLPEEGEC